MFPSCFNSFAAEYSTEGTINANGQTPTGPLVFDSNIVDSICAGMSSNGCFDKTTGTFTAPTQGHYFMWFTATTTRPMNNELGDSHYGGYVNIGLNTYDASRPKDVLYND